MRGREHVKVSVAPAAGKPRLAARVPPLFLAYFVGGEDAAFDGDLPRLPALRRIPAQQARQVQLQPVRIALPFR